MIDGAFPRDVVMMAAIFGVAAFVWSGWAQERPPRGVIWRVVLGAVGVAGVAVAGLSIPLVVRNWRSGTAIEVGGAAWTVYLIVAAIEVVACIALAVWASSERRSDLIASLVLAVVGIHFVPLASVFGQRILVWVGVALTIVAVVAVVLPTQKNARSFWCGILGAPILLVGAVACLLVGRTVVS